MKHQNLRMAVVHYLQDSLFTRSKVICCLSIMLLLCFNVLGNVTFTSDTTITTNQNIGQGEVWTVNSGVTFVIDSGVTLTIQGELLSFGVVHNYGTINNAQSLSIKGLLVNFSTGVISNTLFWDIRNSGQVINHADATINNYNQIHLTDGDMENSGILNNYVFFHINKLSTMLNNLELLNEGSIFLDGSLTNAMTANISNPGEILSTCGVTAISGSFTGNPIIETAFCIDGGLWSEPSNWNLDSLPPANSQIIISGNTELDIFFVLAAEGSISANRLTILSTGGLTSFGDVEIRNISGIVMSNHGLFQNSGNYYSTAILENASDLINEGTIVGNVIIQNSGVVTNGSAGSMTVGFVNDSNGFVFNNGTLNMNRITNYNHGVMSNNPGGEFNINNDLYNETGSVIHNYSNLNVNHNLNFPGDLFNNLGALIHNHAGGVISVTSSNSTINNSGEIFNCFGLINGPIGGLQPICDEDGDGFRLEDGDCDDTDPDIHPGAVEIGCNGIDENCNGNSDDDLPNCFYSYITFGRLSDTISKGVRISFQGPDSLQSAYFGNRSDLDAAVLMVNRRQDDLLLGTNSTSGITIDESGRVGIGMNATTHRFEINGQASKSTPGDWLANSDARLKKNIQKLDPDETLEQLLKLNGVKYEWEDRRTGYRRPTGIQIGLTAQNIQGVYPSLVQTGSDGYLMTSYGTLDPVLIEVLRALQDKIGEIESSNSDLKNRIRVLEQVLGSPSVLPLQTENE